MTDTLFPASGSDDPTDRHRSSDPLEPLTRLEAQLRRSRERLVDDGAGSPRAADAVPAVLAPDAPAVPPPGGDDASTVRPPSPYAALAELTPVHDFVFASEAPVVPEQDREEGSVVLAFPEMPGAGDPLDADFDIPDIPVIELPEPIEALPPLRIAPVPHADEPAASDEDGVWGPFPDVRVGAPDSAPAATVDTPPVTAVPEQDPLPVPKAISRTDADRAVAEAAREVSWLARRVTDGLESMTDRLATFEARFAELADRPMATSGAPQTSAGDDATALEEWSMALARLVRSDSNALRDEVHRIAEEQGVALAEVHRLTAENGARISASVEETIARIDGAVLRLADAVEARLGSAVASLEAAADAMRSEDQEALVRLIDDRMEALARLVRSDNERIAARLEAEIGIGREVLRAAKELQASLANDVASALDQRDRAFRATGSGQR